MKDDQKDQAPCGKYALAIALTGFSDKFSIMNDFGDIIDITEKHVVNAVNHVHDAWDAHRETKKAG